MNSVVEGGPATQKFELAPRAFIDLGRRNLFGKNRSLNLFASVSLHPEGLSSASRVGYGFTEYLTRATFHEPRLFGTAVDGLLNGTIEQFIAERRRDGGDRGDLLSMLLATSASPNSTNRPKIFRSIGSAQICSRAPKYPLVQAPVIRASIALA